MGTTTLGRRSDLFRRAWGGFIIALTLLLSLSCTSSRAPAPSDRAAPTEGAASVPATAGIDFSDVVKRVSRRFRPQGDAWRGGQVTYRVEARPGETRFEPRVPSSTGKPMKRGAELVLGAATVARGGAARAAKRASITPRDNAIGIDRGHAEETFENTEEGLEQSFRFADKPAGKGDVTVRIPVSGQRYAGATEKGLHFVDDATGLGARYGQATWVDARGVKTPVAVAYTNGEIALTVPDDLLEKSAYPAVLDPTIGPEFGLDSPIYSNAQGPQTPRAVSYGGGQHLVLFTDYNALWATRVSGAGVVLDPYGILITDWVTSLSNSGAVAFDGTNWLVTWADFRSGKRDVYGTRISPAGVALDLPGAALTGSAALSPRTDVTITYGGGRYLVAYIEAGVAYAQLVSTAPAPIGTPFTIYTSASAPAFPTAAYNGTDYLVAAVNSGFGPIYARRINTAGAVVGSDILVVSSTATNNRINVASSGTDWLVTFATTTQIRAARVTSAGVATDSASDGFVIGNYLSGYPDHALAWDGTRYGVIWVNNAGPPQELAASRVSTGAAVTSGPGALISELGGHFAPVMSYDTVNGNYLCAFADTRLPTSLNTQDVRFSRLSTAFAKLESPTVLVSRGANPQTSPAAAWNGTNYLVAWADARNANDYDVYAARLDATGNVLDPNGIFISSGQGSQIAVASNGADWIIGYNIGSPDAASNDPLRAVRVQSTGTILDATPINVGSTYGGFRGLAIAYGGGNYVFVSGFNDTATATRRVYVKLVTPAGGVVNGTPIDLGAYNGGTSMAVGYNGTSFLVAYIATTGAVVGKRVNTSGAVLDTNPLTLSFSTATADPSVAGLGGTWLIGWQEVSDIQAARVSNSGTVLDPGGFTVSNATGNQSTPCAVTDGTNFWLVYQDQRVNVNLGDVYGTRVSTAGAIVDPTGVPISTGTYREFSPSAASGPAGQILVLYHHYKDTSMRVYGRIVSSTGTAGTACSTNAECTSGFCVDGVCCQTQCNGVCQACSAAKKGAGADGTCGAVAVNTDPDNDCTDQGAASCGTNGSCDGAGACKLYPSGTSCGSSTCVGNQVAPQICNGTGTCVAGSATDCAPYVCAAGACKNPCTLDTDCVPGNVCLGGTCGPKLGDGANCTAGSQCQSGFCADGVCCNSACNGLCNACTTAKKGAGANGVCGPIMAGLDPDNECATQAPSTCGTDGACNGSGACELWASGTTCGGAVCVGSVAKQQICNGAGTCGAAAGGIDCSPYACTGGACLTSCATGADCAAGFACSNSACVAPAGLGSPCGGAGDCQSGFCVDGVCCNNACGGLCNACSAAKKGGGANGVCGAIAVGADPDNECVLQASSTCGQTGSCNGSGACELYAAGTTCGAPTCIGTVAKLRSCDGAGTCALAVGGTDCTPYACSAGVCKTTCTTTADCAGGFVCSQGSCVPPVANGLPCANGGECASSFCVDGVCCNNACTGLCNACTIAKKGNGSNGVCGPIMAGQDPDSECAQQPQATCGQNGSCNGAGACELWAQGTSCGASTCQGNVVTGQVCNGNGTCTIPPGGQDCAPYVCGNGACKNPCATSSDCVAGNFCNAGQCKPLGAAGAPCAAAGECQSGFCADGVCCNSACNSLCQACSAAKKGQGVDGACGAVAAGLDPHDDCASSSPSSCGLDGTCDGANACAFFAASTVCAPASCAAGTATAASTCDGQGTCKPGATTLCQPGYACAGTTCATSCVDDSACESGYHCVAGACAAEDGGTGGTGTGGANTGGSSTGGANTGGANTGGANTGGANTGGANTGGANTGGKGNGGDGVDAGTGGKPAPEDKSGCGCRTVGGDGGSSAGAAAFALLAIGMLRRRRAAVRA